MYREPKMNKIKKQNKKGVSEIVSYTLLIIIAIGLSVMVYSYLKVYAPKEKVECNEDIFAVIKQASCSVSGGSALLNITIQNKGLFNISSFYLRVGLEGRTTKYLITGNMISVPKQLAPGDEFSLNNLDMPNDVVLGNGNYSISVQPATLSDKKQIVLCANSVISQPIECN